MRRVTLIVAAAAMVGCAHQTVGQAPSSGTGAKSGPSCSFRQLAWNAWPTLLLPQTGQPFAVLYGSRAGQVRFTGSFRRRGTGVALEGIWSNPAFELEAAVDATHQPLVYSRQPLRQGRWFLAAPEARLNVAGLTASGLQVRPEADLFRRVHPKAPLQFSLACADLTLHQPPVVIPKGGSPRQYPPLVESEGLSAQTPHAPLTQLTGVELAESPGGAPVATVDFTAYDQVAVAERQSGFARIGFEIRKHVFVFGWVHDGVLGASMGSATPVGSIGGGLGAPTVGDPPPQYVELRCPEARELQVGLDGARHRIGRVLPGARLKVLGPAYEGWLPVTLLDVNLSTSAGVALLVPETAAACAQGPPPL